MFFLKIFYWSMVALQCCVSLHCTTKWISHTHTGIPFLLDFPPIQVTTVHQVEFPEPYSMFPSVVSFIHSINNVYMSMPVSQFLPPHPFPAWYPYICSLCMCLYFCSAYEIIYIIFLDSTYMHYYTILAFLFLTYFTLYDTLQVHSPLYK